MVGMVFNMSRMVNLLMYAMMSSMMGLNCVDSTVMNRHRCDRMVTSHMMRLRSVMKVMNHWWSSSPMMMNGWSWSSDNGWQRGSNSRAVMEWFRTVMMNGCQSSMNRGMSRLNWLMMEWTRRDGRQGSIVVSMGISGIYTFNVVVDIVFTTSLNMIIVSRMVKQSLGGMDNWMWGWMNNIFMVGW